MQNRFNLTEGEIRSRLSAPKISGWLEDKRYQNLFDTPSLPAAVLIPFLRPDGPDSPWHILFTRRTDLVEHHKGQVAFPGGRSDPGEIYPQQTALREAQEEIGIYPEDVVILGELEPLHTISNYRVVPVIGVIPWPYPYQLERNEVSRIFTIPVAWLADPTHLELRPRPVTFPGKSEPEILHVFYFQPYDGEVLWGVSAEITLRLLKRLGIIKETS